VLWTCLRFPQLALDAVRVDTNAQPFEEDLKLPSSRPFDGLRTGQASPEPAPSVLSSRPFAVIDGPLQRRRIMLANAPAEIAGVRAGQPLTAAQVLCHRLCVTPRDEAAERQALESLAALAYRFSAEINIAAPDSVFVEVGASLALFGGWPALERRLRSELDAFGFAFSLAAAPTAAGARVLATHADGIAIPTIALLANALGAVPLAASGFDAKTIAALQGMGFRDLHDLFRLPRAELARRIGPGTLDHLDRMRGLAAEALPRYQPADRFQRRIEFSFGIESQTALVFPLQRLIRELATFLIARDGGVQHFALVLGHERGASTRVEVGLIAPQRDAAALFDLARVRLERIELPAPVHALTLRADDLPPLCPLHHDLFESNRHEELDWPALAERLRARLGDEALRSLRCATDHRPGRAWQFVSVIEAPSENSRRSGFSRDAFSSRIPNKSIAAEAAPTKADARRRAAANVSVGSASKMRPFWLLRRPIPLRGAPARVLAGPERIESGWWDDHDQRRDYYIVETRSGQRAWAFVEASSSVDAGTMSHWTLHGWFA
jgi:protein ImuB